jgi:type I restriction enzyme, S subunit
MIADLKSYAEYKESGLPWLGRVPGHWETRPAFGAFVPNHERNHGMKERAVLSLSYGRIVIKPAEKLYGLVPESFETYQIVNPGDIVLRTTDLQNDHTSLRVGMVRDRGIITSAYLALRVNAGVSPDFGFQFLNVWDTSKAIYGYGSGLRQNLDFSHFKRMPVPVPPPEEQAAIVRFLDWANGRLERAIRAKRKVIALLNEQKQAIIHRAVTRGLDPSVPLSADSRPFLERLPAHWPVFRAKLLFRQVVPPIPDGAGMVTCFRDGQVTLRRNRRTTGFTNAIWELGYQGIAPGQLVLHSMDAFAGAIGVSDSSGKCSPEYVICEPAIEGVLPYYYAHLLRSLALRGLFVALCPSVRERAPRVRFNDFGLFVLPKPPVSEQREIVDYICDACGNIDASLAIIRREAELLREYRTRLVADVATGKLDVRTAVAKLPEEVDGLEAPDDADALTEGDEETGDVDLDAVTQETEE